MPSHKYAAGRKVQFALVGLIGFEGAASSCTGFGTDLRLDAKALPGFVFISIEKRPTWAALNFFPCGPSTH